MTYSLARTSTSRYVTRDSKILQGEPAIVGTQVAVRDIVLLWKSGVKPEEIPEKLMRLVTVAQVFDAISFYLDNQQEIDEYIEFFVQHPPLNVPFGLRANPLLDEVRENVAAYHRDRNEVSDLEIDRS